MTGNSIGHESPKMNCVKPYLIQTVSTTLLTSLNSHEPFLLF